MAVSVSIAPMTALDAAELAAKARAIDSDEVLAQTGRPILEVVLEAAAESEVYAVRFGGELACVYGVEDIGVDGAAGVWMLATDLVHRKPIMLWKTALHVLPGLLERYELLTNWVMCKHESAVRFLGRLGFRLEEPAPLVPGGEAFRQFFISKEDLRCAPR